MSTRSRRSSSFQESPTQVPVTHRRQRSASHTALSTYTDVASAETLARTILKQVRTKLLNQNVDPRGFTYVHLQAFLPYETDNKETLRIFRSWINEPLLVPDSDLWQILRCQPSVKRSLRMKHTTVCYYRSWAMTREQLQNVLFHLEEQNCFFKRAQHWMSVSRIAKPDQIITIRYVGKTAYPSSPYARFYEDLRKGRGSLLFRLFLSALRTVFPHVYASGCPYLLSDSIIKWFPKEDKHKLEILGDRYERFLISFFNPRALLNQQQGGNSIDFIPPIEDEALFYRCGTSTVTKVQKLLHPSPWSIHHQTYSLFREVTDWIKIPGSILRNERIALNERYLDILCFQSIPHSVNNQNIVAFCGLAVSKRSFKEGLGFFQGQSKSARFVSEMLDHLIGWEQRDPRFNHRNVEVLFTFNNLFNWSPALGKDVWVASVSTQRLAFSVLWNPTYNPVSLRNSLGVG